MVGVTRWDDGPQPGSLTWCAAGFVAVQVDQELVLGALAYLEDVSTRGSAQPAGKACEADFGVDEHCRGWLFLYYPTQLA